MDAINHSMVRIRDSYALAVMFKDYPEEIYVARKDSPLIIGVEKNEVFVASDVLALLKHTRNVYYIGNLSLAQFSETKWEKRQDEFINKVQEIAQRKAEQPEGEFDSTINEMDSGSLGVVVSYKFLDHIPVEAAFLLVYAADGDGRILKTNSISVG